MLSWHFPTSMQSWPQTGVCRCSNMVAEDADMQEVPLSQKSETSFTAALEAEINSEYPDFAEAAAAVEQSEPVETAEAPTIPAAMGTLAQASDQQAVPEVLQTMLDETLKDPDAVPQESMPCPKEQKPQVWSGPNPCYDKDGNPKFVSLHTNTVNSNTFKSPNKL